MGKRAEPQGHRRSRATEDNLRVDPLRAAAMSAEERRVFVMDDLAVIIAAANKKTDAADENDILMIRSGEI
jgi:hypothetical protein